MRVVIIGAGASGLASARYLSASGHECEILDARPELGGTWLYTDDVGKDKYGFPVYSPMYKELTTNVTNDVMGFPDFPVPKSNKNYLKRPEVLAFINSYADHFNLKPLIKYNRFVTHVKPIDGDQWLITSIDKPTNNEIKETCDAVVVCNGHNNVPFYIKLEGIEKFKGEQCHSHKYRTPERFAGLRVLVIGGGASGKDIANQIARVASEVVLSHHCKECIKMYFDYNVEEKGDVKRIVNAEEIEFEDGSIKKFDVILYCTGYQYSFPFLDMSCKITVSDNVITPLYKQIINIEKPTMAFIGIPGMACAFQMMDIQARFLAKYLNGELNLPPVEEMYKDFENYLEDRRIKGYPRRQAHLLGLEQGPYFNDLAKTAGIEGIPDSIVSRCRESRECYKEPTFED